MAQTNGDDVAVTTNKGSKKRVAMPNYVHSRDTSGRRWNSRLSWWSDFFSANISRTTKNSGIRKNKDRYFGVSKKIGSACWLEKPKEKQFKTCKKVAVDGDHSEPLARSADFRPQRYNLWPKEVEIVFVTSIPF